jgi:conjugative transfer signal peptidase TraF
LKRRLRSLTLAVLTIAAAFDVVAILGLRWNATPSMPVGLWRTVTFSAPPQRGQIAVICLDGDAARLALARGYVGSGSCPLHLEELFKPIAAIPGDVVQISDDGVMVNGHRLSGIVPLIADSKGRTLPTIRATYRVQPGSVWLLSGHDPRSFDSRYFGPVPIASIHAYAIPVIVEE